MILFIFKSMLCMSLLFTVYKLFLEQNKMHQFNRFYLLGILLISVSIPNLNIPLEHSFALNENLYAEPTQSAWDKHFYYILSVYGIVAFVMLLRLLGGLKTILNKVKRSERHSYQDVDVVLIKERVLPHSFLKYVFVNEDDYKNETIEKELFTHEVTHIKEQHTLDILLVELFHIIFWFNPLIYFIKKSIRLNHEFIADQAVIEFHEDQVKYQEILIGLSSSSQPMLTSHIDYGLMKKRFIMMASETTKQRIHFIKLGLIPIFILTLFLFSNTSSGEEHTLEEHHVEHEHYGRLERHQ